MRTLSYTPNIKLQVALDLLDLNSAIKIAKLAVDGGADIVEAGTPLIKKEGVRAVSLLKKEFHDIPIAADTKTIDAAALEVEAVADAGADIITVLGVADDEVILTAVSEAHKRGLKVCGDLISVKNPIKRAIELEEMGVDMVCLHVGVDVQRSRGITVTELINELSELSRSLKVPVCVAGGINWEIAPDLVLAGARIVIVGSAITRSPDPKASTLKIKRAIDSVLEK